MVSSFDISVFGSSLHGRAVALVGALRTSELALAEVLGAMWRSGEFRAYASSITDYAQLIGLGRGKGRQLAVIGHALPELPMLHHVMQDGRIGWTAAFEVARVAVGETEAGWLVLAENWSVRELRAAACAHVKGEPAPDESERPDFGVSSLRFELTAEDAQVVSRAMTLLRSRAAADSAPCGAGPSDSELLVEMARIAVSVEAPGQGVGGERFTTVIRECPSCESATLAGLPDGARADVSATTREMARCDSTVVHVDGLGRGSAELGRAHATVSPRVRRLVMERDGYRCATPGCSNWLHLDVHHVVHRKDGGGNGVSNLVALCSGCHARVHEGVLQVEPVLGDGFRFEWTSERAGVASAGFAIHAT